MREATGCGTAVIAEAIAVVRIVGIEWTVDEPGEITEKAVERFPDLSNKRNTGKPIVKEKLVNIYKSTNVEAVEIEPGRKRRLIHTDNLMVVVWDFAGGPWESPDSPHSHPHEQVTYIVKGEILFFLGDDMQRLSTGDMVAVPSNVPHYIQLVSSHVRLIDSFTPLRQEFL